jgi:hypothetical protein
MLKEMPNNLQGPLWSHGSWIYNYLCNQIITTNVVSSSPAHDEVYLIQHYVIKIFSDLRQIGGFLHQKTDWHKITEILLKVALNTITLTNQQIPINA